MADKNVTPNEEQEPIDPETSEQNPVEIPNPSEQPYPGEQIVHEPMVQDPEFNPNPPDPITPEEQPEVISPILTDPSSVSEPPVDLKDNPIDPDTLNPQASENNPETSHETLPGEGNPDELHPVTDEDFVGRNDQYDPSELGDGKAEQTEDKAGRMAGFNEFLHGDHMAKPENPLIYHAPSDIYEANKNKENR